HLRRETTLLEQGREGEVPRNGASLQQVVLEPHVDGPRRRTRTIERRRRELQTPTRGFIRPARGQPVVLHAVRPALVVTRTLALLAGLVAAGTGCSRNAERPHALAAGPQHVVRTVAAPDAHYSPDEYVQLTATRVHVSPPQRSAFWQAVGSYFVD